MNREPRLVPGRRSLRAVIPALVMSIPVLSNFQSHLLAAVFHMTILSSCLVPRES